jgi:enoyl-CoA hydratase/3-hydroxyacyl-CoA dehydrogenase
MPDKTLPKRIAVIGAGTIGPDIVYYLKSTIPGLELFLVDVVSEALEKAKDRIAAYAEKGLARKKLTAQQARAVTENLVATLDYGEIAPCEWVVEAATENLQLKHQIFEKIEDVVSSDTLITSNTSSLPASRLFTHLTHKRRATVTHFFAPAFTNPVVEIVNWKEVDPAVIQRLRWLFCATGKVPMVTTDAICFMFDRVFDNWCNEAAGLLAEASAAEVDSTASDLVHAGPFYVLNLARGNPIIVETNTLQMEEGEHYRPAPILRSVDTWATLKPGERSPVAPETAARIRDRLLGILFSQTCDILDRGIGTPEDLNLGCCLALGFKRGPLDLMRDLGNEEVRRIQSRFAEDRPRMPSAARALQSYQNFRRHILVDDMDGVKVITLRRPQVLNALNDELNDEVLGVLQEHEQDPDVSGFVVIGYGTRAFCAGADIERFTQVLGDHGQSAQYARDCSRLLVHIDTMTKPVVCALNGMALGGGLELALRCHEIVAQRDAWLQFPEVTLGIAPGIGGMTVPYRRWPRAASIFHAMLRTAQKLTAVEAHEAGVVVALAASYDELVQTALERVRNLRGVSLPTPDGAVVIEPPPDVEPVAANGLRLSCQTIGLITEAIQESAQAPSLADALEIGYRAFADTACTAAAKEGIAAFLERRKPDFERSG